MRYAFEDCVLDAARRELRQAGEVARLEPKVYHVLAYLVQHAERLVMQRELLKHGWPDVIVEPIAVACSIPHIRQAVGGHPKVQRKRIWWSGVCRRGASACCGHVCVWSVCVSRKARTQALSEGRQNHLHIRQVEMQARDRPLVECQVSCEARIFGWSIRRNWHSKLSNARCSR